MRTEVLGGLRVRLSGGNDGQGGGPGPLLVLLHGFGAPGDDLVPLANYLRAAPGLRFAFPEAPLSLGSLGFGDSRAWWMIDLPQFESAIARNRPDEITHHVPEGLAEAREKVLAALDALETRFAASPILLGGFSQGAMLSCDVALRAPRRLAGLVLLSGMPVALDEWKPLFATQRGLPVFMSHGTQDPIIPYPLSEHLRDQLNQAGIGVDFHRFHGGHEIPMSVLEKLGGFLRAVL
jgi:phospholipase/carboxylesterase